MATQADIDALYRQYLGRGADDWALENRTWQSADEIRSDLLSSSELASKPQQVAKLYQSDKAFAASIDESAQGVAGAYEQYLGRKPTDDEVRQGAIANYGRSWDSAMNQMAWGFKNEGLIESYEDPHTGEKGFLGGFGGILGGVIGGVVGFVASGFNPVGAAAGASLGAGILGGAEQYETHHNLTDYGETLAWSAAAAAAGPIGGAIVKAAEGKAHGGDWSDFAVQSAIGYATGNIFAGSPELMALAQAGSTALTGGNAQEAFTAGASMYAGAWVGGKVFAGTQSAGWAHVAQAGTSSGAAYLLFDDSEFSEERYGDQAGEQADYARRFAAVGAVASGLQNVAMSAMSDTGGGNFAELHPFDPESYALNLKDKDYFKTRDWLSPALYNPDIVGERKWLNIDPLAVRDTERSDLFWIRDDGKRKPGDAVALEKITERTKAEKAAAAASKGI